MKEPGWYWLRLRENGPWVMHEVYTAAGGLCIRTGHLLDGEPLTKEHMEMFEWSPKLRSPDEPITDDENRCRYHIIGCLLEERCCAEWKIVLYPIIGHPASHAYVEDIETDGRFPWEKVSLFVLGPPLEEPVYPPLKLYDYVVETGDLEADIRNWFKTFWPEAEVPKFRVEKYKKS